VRRGKLKFFKGAIAQFESVEHSFLKECLLTMHLLSVKEQNSSVSVVVVHFKRLYHDFEWLVFVHTNVVLPAAAIFGGRGVFGIEAYAPVFFSFLGLVCDVDFK